MDSCLDQRVLELSCEQFFFSEPSNSCTITKFFCLPSDMHTFDKQITTQLRYMSKKLGAKTLFPKWQHRMKFNICKMLLTSIWTQHTYTLPFSLFLKINSNS